MQTATNINLVLTDSSSFGQFAHLQKAISYGGFYQHLASKLARSIHTKQTLDELGKRLMVLAEHAHAFRQTEILEWVSESLVRLPLPHQYQVVGLYYQAACIQNFGRGDLRRGMSLLEPIVDSAPRQYRARAMLSLAASTRYQCDSHTALSLYCEADRFVSRCRLYDPYTTITAQRMVAVIA